MATGHVDPKVCKDGKVHYQITIEGEKDPLTGKRDRSYRTVRCTRKEAVRIMNKMIEEKEAGGIVKQSSKKVGDWMWEWLDTYCLNIAATTRASYTEKIKNYIVPGFGNIPLKAMKASSIQLWVNNLHKNKGLAPKTIKNAYLNLKAALDKAVVLRMIPYNPCAGVELPKQEKYKGPVYTVAEMNQAVTLAKGTDFYLTVLLATHLGLRRGELIALRWSDIDLKANMIYIRNNTVMAEGKKITKAPKSEAGNRDLSIDTKLASTLKAAHAEYLEKKLAYGPGFSNSDLVICKEDGNGYRPDSITQKWGRFVKQHNLKKIHLHGLRHSCATAMIEAGVDPKTVQARLGHADISVTMNIYAHATRKMDREAADKLGFLLAV